MVIVKEKDFVEVSFVGRVKESNQIFDLTDEALAKKEGLYDEHGHHHYGPKTICVGQGQLIPGLDKALVGKEVGKEFKVEIQPKDAFGIKDSKLIKTVPTTSLTKQNIRPFPGLQVQGGGMLGTIRTVSGGRTTIDFNHPLASKELVYEVKINKIVEDDQEKVKSLLFNLFHAHEDSYELKVENKDTTIKFKEQLPNELKEALKKRIKELVPSLEISFA